jgi:hypothetical protein
MAILRPLRFCWYFIGAKKQIISGLFCLPDQIAVFQGFPPDLPRPCDAMPDESTGNWRGDGRRTGFSLGIGAGFLKALAGKAQNGSHFVRRYVEHLRNFFQ